MMTLAYAFIAILSLATLTWLVSIRLKDVSIVDSVWSLLFVAAGLVYVSTLADFSLRTQIIFGLLLIWAVRLAGYLTWRNWGKPEDHRYQVIRAKYDPHFALKSLGIIFVFQGVLAFIVSISLWPALTHTHISALDLLGVTLWVVGMSFETIGDWQLARFKANPANKGKVMDQGLWRYTRHPNYFGECLVWWGFFVFALSAGAWWTIVSPLLMTWLLLKFSGVVMLEGTIVERRPAYREYIARTNAFFPGRPRHAQ
jgi:steroid 5-alpha reductase family enzyme